jgi:hypothetical protein
MSATYSYSPRTPGCVLLYFLIGSLASKFVRSLQRLSSRNIQSMEKKRLAETRISLAKWPSLRNYRW